MTDTDTLALEIARKVENIISDTLADRAIQRQARVQVVVKNALDAALADRDAKIAGLRKHSHQRAGDLRTLAAQVAELTRKLERATEAFTALFAAIDAGRMVERGAGGMTIEAQMKRSVYNGVPAWPVEEAREKCAFLNSGDSQNG